MKNERMNALFFSPKATQQEERSSSVPSSVAFESRERFHFLRIFEVRETPWAVAKPRAAAPRAKRR